jgi:hypothetical protein
MVTFRAHPRRTLVLWIVLLALVSLATGCADLQAIRQFAQSSTEAETYQAIANDYAAVPEREKYYSLTKFHASYDQQTKERNAQVQALLDIQRVITEYMKALGELAADELVSYDTSIDALAEQVKATKALDDAQIQALGGITKLLARAVTDRYRQKKLNQVITEANTPLQTLIAAQIKFVNIYIKTLDAEKLSIDRYYGDVILSALDENLRNAKDVDKAVIATKKKALDNHYGDIIMNEIKDPTQQGVLILIRDDMQHKSDTLSKKQESARDYIEILKTIGAGHQKLFEERNKLKSALLLATIKSYASQINDLMNAVKALK